MTTGPGSCGSDRSMTMELLSITVSHHVWARPSNWRLAIFNLWSSERSGFTRKYVDMLHIHKSMASPFIWSKTLGVWTFASNWIVEGGVCCCIWINWCNTSANYFVGVDMFAEDFSSAGSRSCRGGMIFIPKQDEKASSLDVLAHLITSSFPAQCVNKLCAEKNCNVVIVQQMECFINRKEGNALCG